MVPAQMVPVRMVQARMVQVQVVARMNAMVRASSRQAS